MPIKPLVKTWQGDNNMCGQYCLAMVLDAPLDQMTKTLGRGKTSINELMKFLTAEGYEVTPANDISEGRGLAFYRWNRGLAFHVVAWEDGVFYDSDGEHTGLTLDEVNADIAQKGAHVWGIRRLTPVKTREWKVGEPS